MPLRAILRSVSPLVALVLLAAGCGGGARGPVSSDPRLAGVSWDSTTPPREIADWIDRSCARLTGPSRECVERSLYGALERGGISRAMGALDILAARSTSIRADAHGHAHGLGIAAYTSPQTLGKTFADCPPSQMSGCYHGVIQGYFLAMRATPDVVTPAALDALCREQKERSDFLFFQCTHGLGHGVMALVDNHLPHALETCDLLSDSRVREDCYSGAFMENVIAATHPHHTAGAHAAVGGGHGSHGAQGGGDGDGHAGHGAATSSASGDAHAGHGQPAAGSAPDPHAAHGAASSTADPHAGHGAASSTSTSDPHAGHGAGATTTAADPHAGHGAAASADPHAGHGASAAPGLPAGPWRALDRRDLHYPCSVVADRYKPGCYENQAGAMLFLTGGNTDAVARACATAPGVNARVCFQSLGRNIVAAADQEAQRAVSMCARADEPGRGWCSVSVATTLANLSGDPTPGFRTCALVAPGTKATCYEAVGALLFAAERDATRREALCAGVETGFVSACRAGARLDSREE